MKSGSPSSANRVYQSAAHPERMRLVFTTQLHHQLQTIARSREINAPEITSRSGGNGSHATRAREVNGWELEKKVAMLKDVRPLLEKPFFLYVDCGSGDVANGSSPGSPSSGGGVVAGVSSFFSMDGYFNKTLPLALGQQSLLDVWTYVMDMCEFVPARNRCRSLYLHIGVCICRRVEFIRGYAIDGEPVTMDDNAHERYHSLLGRCIALCTSKLTHSRILLEENALFMAHIYSTVCVRFPSRAGKVFDALVEGTRALEVPSTRPPRIEKLLERVRSRSEPQTAHSYDQTSGSAAARKLAKEMQQCRSPRETQRNWNGLTDFERRNSEIRPDERMKGILSAFSTYKLSRRRHATPAANGNDNTNDSATGRHPYVATFSRRTVESSLCQAFEAELHFNEPITPEEVAFIQRVPVLFAFSGLERKVLIKRRDLGEELDLGLTMFAERLQRPARDDVLFVNFIGAYLSDLSYWCNAAFASGSTVRSSLDDRILWHTLPGYFCVVRAFVALFKRMCQRRPRMTSNTQATVGNILSIVQGNGVDVWASYWTSREITAVIDSLGEVAKNPRLVNIFVEIVLESTNIHDPASVNYSFSVLQRVLEASAIASRDTSAASSIASSRGSLSPEFDDAYFCNAVRKALMSSHVQILLKALTFLYSCLDLLPPRGRRRIITELVIRENFFRLFLHWNEEIRKIYGYIIVFKIFASNRLDLPCASDHVLLARSPFFQIYDSGGNSGSGVAMLSPSASSPSFGYWSHLGEIAQSILKTPAPELREEQRRAAISNGLSNLTTWDSHGALLVTGSRGDKPRRVSLFRASLDDEDISIDLLVASKLDSSLKMVADQVGNKATTTTSQYFPVEQEAYAERALSQYVTILWENYAAAFERPSAKPTAPKLEFTISSPFSNSD